jgi:hypothetical protein
MDTIRSEFTLLRQEGDDALYRRTAPARGRNRAAR